MVHEASLNTEKTCLELFAGAGGLAIGTGRAGFRHVAAVERDPRACETLRANAGFPVLEADATEIGYAAWAGVDLVCGGPPCQPFSSGGRAEGSRDARDMFPTLVRAVRETGPNLVLVENVKGLLRPKFSLYLQYILGQLSRPSVAPLDRESVESHMLRLSAADAEYHVTHILLNAADFGVPQVRERVFLLASKAGGPTGPDCTHSLQSLLRHQWLTGGYWDGHGIEPVGGEWPPRLAKRIASAIGDDDSRGAPWHTVRDAISDIMGDAPARPAKSYKGHTGSGLDMPSKTLKAGVHGVPGGENMVRTPDGDRHYTTREAARVQGFPDSWAFNHSWTGSMRQIGNAVPPPLAEAVARALAAGA